MTYALGHSEGEVRRLELQAGMLAPGTESILRAAGLGPGMSVLDIGTGAGDVAMLHQQDRSAFLRAAAAHVRPGGVLAIVDLMMPEPNLPRVTTEFRWPDPPVPLYDPTRDLAMVGLAPGGARTETGLHLVRLFDEAGLPRPCPSWEEVVSGPVFELWYQTLGSLLPVPQRHGVTSADEIGFDTLQARVKAAVSEACSRLRIINLIGGWVRIGGGAS